MANGINALALRGRVPAVGSLDIGTFDPSIAQNALLAGQREQRAQEANALNRARLRQQMQLAQSAERRAEAQAGRQAAAAGLQSRLTNLRISEAERTRNEAVLDDLTANVLGATSEADFITRRDAFARRRGIDPNTLSGITFADLPALRAEAEGAKAILARTQQAQRGGLTQAQVQQRNALTGLGYTPAQATAIATGAIKAEDVPIPAGPTAPAVAAAPPAAVTPTPGPAVPTVTPVAAAAPLPAATTPAPAAIPGETPRIRRERQITEARERARARVATEGRQRVGQGVLQSVDQLEALVGDPQGTPAERATADLFERSTGPFVAGDSPNVGIQRGLEGAVQTSRELFAATPFGGGTQEELSYLDRIRTQAASIRSQLAGLRRGEGALSDRERADLNRILGNVEQARSALEARAQLDEFRRVTRTLFGLPPAAAPAPTVRTPAPAPAPAPRRRGTAQAAPAPRQPAQPTATQGQRFDTIDEAGANLAEGQLLRQRSTNQWYQKQGDRMVPVQDPALGNQFQFQGQPGIANPVGDPNASFTFLPPMAGQ